MATKSWSLEKTIKITKEYARGGGSERPNTILEMTYNKLVELDETTRD